MSPSKDSTFPTNQKVEDKYLHDAETGEMDEIERQKLTRKILWKLDTRYGNTLPLFHLLIAHRVLPVLALLFLCSFLDRTNVGNAKILGLENDLGLSNDQYANGLAIFFAFYIAAELPSNLVLKRLTPSVWLAFLTVCWGIVGMCLGFVRNYAGFLLVRAFLGLTEGGLLPGMVLYLASMYTRAELALRIGLFVSLSLPHQTRQDDRGCCILTSNLNLRLRS